MSWRIPPEVGGALAGLFLWLDEYLATRRVRDLSLAALSAAVAFASKENFYVLLALMVPSL
jgi:predicted membrane-bound dolichyl-phosphate-mannose-protein mannosyltransferase